VDTAIGFDWVAYANATAGYHSLFAITYKSMMWQPAFTAFVLFLSKQSNRGWQMVLAATVALAITALLFPLAPALGSSEFYQIRVWTPAGEFSPVLGNLKSGLRVLDSSTFVGLVSFPSYHAAAAGIFVWGCWTTWFRWPVLFLNIVMCFSAITMGAHYLIDIYAGLAVAILSIVLARRCLTGPRQRDIAQISG
jgi:membrane-associated phospholipid phosphatase